MEQRSQVKYPRSFASSVKVPRHLRLYRRRHLNRDDLSGWRSRGTRKTAEIFSPARTHTSRSSCVQVTHTRAQFATRSTGDRPPCNNKLHVWPLPTPFVYLCEACNGVLTKWPEEANGSGRRAGRVFLTSSARETGNCVMGRTAMSSMAAFRLRHTKN